MSPHDHNLPKLSARTRIAIAIAMGGVLGVGHLLEREVRTRWLAVREDGRVARAALLAPIEDAHLPRVPRTPIAGGVLGDGTIHVVAKGETLGTIAAKRLGTSQAWKTLLAMNKAELPSPEALRVGMRLRIPGPSWERANASLVSSATSSPAHEAGIYVVGPGDTLSTIAKKTLGSTRAIPRLVAANPDTLASPDRLSVGMRLKIPRE